MIYVIVWNEAYNCTDVILEFFNDGVLLKLAKMEEKFKFFNENNLYDNLSVGVKWLVLDNSLYKLFLF